jgi:hypothetical protein
MLDAIVDNNDSMQALAGEITENNKINSALRQEIARSQLTNTTSYNDFTKALGELELPKREDYASFEEYS